VVVSPGVPIAHPVFAAAAAAGVAVRSEIEVGWRVLAGRVGPRPLLVAVTGTNGKTTVTTEVAAMLAATGLRVATAGNIGTPLVDVADADLDVIVAEVSSFQLSGTDGWHPDVSCWLNFSPDHLDWHRSLDDYASAKARIWANQGPGDTVVVNADDDAIVGMAGTVDAGARLVTFSTTGPADYHLDRDTLMESDRILAHRADLVRALPHDVANALAALAVARAAGASPQGCVGALRGANPLPHRVELVAEADGVAWYDDSKATTPASVLAAVAGFDSVVLIAGGRNKGLDLGVLVAGAPPIRHAVAIGDATGEVESALGPVVPVTRAATMVDAVALAGAVAQRGDAIVLSPGCASFDWYRSYAQRGDDFARLVRARIAASTTFDHEPGPTPGSSQEEVRPC
ncbi:MAG: UDP-N-acetylmuramoyl-L-alanine--D-glutamate ligase, partial [Actinomycetota bacterium]|nr:UDP-N-acetylmuramoyl-L-alanine--D-glutamate ligase [Actinomycetota bacterium]